MPCAGDMHVAIVMPSFNEADSLAKVIGEIRNYCAYPIYVVDDVSTDESASIARGAGATVIPLVNKLGAWGATQAGVRYALQQGHDAVITMDSDGQHDPAYIAGLLAPLENALADVCIGSCTERGSVLRHLAWRLLRATSGIRIEDLTSGYRAYNLPAMRQLATWQATFLDFQDVGVLSLLLSKNLRIVDIETPMRSRSNGSSRIFRSWIVVAYYMCHTILLGLTKRPIHRVKLEQSSAAETL